MKIVQVNSVCGFGSTGRIAVEISELLNSNGIENYIMYGRNESNYKNAVKIGNKINTASHLLKSRLLGKHGFYSKFATKELVDKLKEINPDVIHLHNIHGYYLNVKILFDYLKDHNKKVVWTLHDCWSYTGHCAYYDFVDCQKWQTECHDCPQLKEYPASLIFDRSKESYNDKKEIFKSVKDITFVTPSKWLKDELSKSYFSTYATKVINNGINLNKFKPVKSEIKKELNIENRFMILGVASKWEKRKGLNYFIELSNMISQDEVIVLVGLSKEQKESLPNNIIGLLRTSSIEELVQMYSAADVFVNPTLEDNFPTANIEALACGTPVVTFDTGGSPEIIDKQTGIVVEKENTQKLYKAVKDIKENGKTYYSKDCELRAKSNYNKDEKFMEYIDLYKDILERSK